MKLDRLEIQNLRIPFRESFRHSSAERRETESVLVMARDRSGLAGYGESCPRSYVTGEDLNTLRVFFDAHHETLIRDVRDLESLENWTLTHTAVIDADPAAWCAIELALLDLLARKAKQSVEDLLAIRTLSGGFQYTAVIGDGSFEHFRAKFSRYRAIGMTDFKIKISGKLDDDRKKLDVLKQCDDDALRVRLDGNNLWHRADEALAYLEALDTPLLGFEEPLQRNEYTELAQITAASGVAIILDESFLRCQQFDLLQGLEPGFLINLRVSKMGGIIRSLRIVEESRRRGIGLIIGAQVGETSLLTRAALTITEQARDLLVAQEGAFGGLLLTHDPWQPSLSFGSEGMLDISEISESGFGLEPV